MDLPQSVRMATIIVSGRAPVNPGIVLPLTRTRYCHDTVMRSRQDAKGNDNWRNRNIWNVKNFWNLWKIRNMTMIYEDLQ